MAVITSDTDEFAAPTALLIRKVSNQWLKSTIVDELFERHSLLHSGLLYAALQLPQYTTRVLKFLPGCTGGVYGQPPCRVRWA